MFSLPANPAASPPVGVADLWFGPALDALRHTRRWFEHGPGHRPEAPGWTLPSRVGATFPAATLRIFGAEEGPCALIVPPEINGPQIADFGPGQSLVQAVLHHGYSRVALLCWRSADTETKDFGIDDSVATIVRAIEALGAPVPVIGICQGGWEAVLAASLRPKLFRALVVGASPIDFHAGGGGLSTLTRLLPPAHFQALVSAGGGVMRGDLLRFGFDALRPIERTVGKAMQLWNQVDAPDVLTRLDRLERWYGHRKDLPGRMYLEAVERLFRNNELVRGTMTVAGERIDPSGIRCPVVMLAGARDHITPQAQVFALGALLSDVPRLQHVVDAGHVGIFIGHESLREDWPIVLRWLDAMA